MSPYRDPLAGLESQVATKRAVALAKHGELSPVLRALLPEDLRRSLDQLSHLETVTQTMESLTAAEAILDSLLAAYDRADALAPSLREFPEDVADPPPCRMPPPWLIEEADILALRAALVARLERIAVGAVVSRWGDFAYIARFRIVSAPFVFDVRADAMPDDGKVALHQSGVRTSLPESLRSLTVARENAFHRVGKALHLARDLEVGDPVFDGQFWIAGDEELAALLTPDVRAALQRLENDSLSLVIGCGFASVRWTGARHDVLDEPIPEAALDVLMGLRRAIEEG